MKLNLPVLGVQEIGRPKFRRLNPAENTGEYRYRQPVYDVYMVDVATALDSQTLFSTGFGVQFTPTGGTGFQKTQFHTNLPQPGGQFPKPNWMIVKAISLQIDPRIENGDMRRFLFQTLLTLNIIDRDYLKIQAFKVPGGGGPWAGGSSAIAGNGEPRRDNQFTFEGATSRNMPGLTGGEVIRPQQNFRVTLDPTQATLADGAATLTTAAAAAGGVGVSAFVHLDGLFNRLAQ